jgi:hydrogenase maturation protease
MIKATLILGLGNPILSDDGIGIVLARRLEKRLPDVDVATANMVGLDLLEVIGGYRVLFVIDALATVGGRSGTLHLLSPADGTLHLFSSHGVNFFEILELGRQLGKPMPEVKAIYGIEIDRELPFGEELTALVANKLENYIEEIVRDIRALGEFA